MAPCGKDKTGRKKGPKKPKAVKSSEHKTGRDNGPKIKRGKK